RTGRDHDGRVIILPPTTADEHIVVQRESKARTTLLQSIPDDHVADFHYMDDARDIWNAVKARFSKNAESKKIRKYMLKQEFSEFRIGKAEGLHKVYDRIQKILSQLNQLKAKPEDEDINLKFLRALPSSWSQAALTLKTKSGLELLSFDDLYYKLKTLEVDVQGYTTFSSSQSAGPSHSAFVSTTSASKKMSYGDSLNYSSTTTHSVPSNSKTGLHKSEKLDLEEMEWQMAMLSVRVHKFEQKARRKIDFDKKESARAKGGNDKQRYSSFKIKEIGKKEEDSKALITVDTLVDCTDHDGKSNGVIASKEFGMIAGCDTEDAIEESAAKIYNLIIGADTEEAITAGDAGEFAIMGVTFELTLEDKIRVLSIKLENTSNLLKHSERINADVETAKKDLQTKLDNHLVQTEQWRNSSKNLFRLIDSSMSVRTKVGLGFNNYIRENELGWDDSAFSVFTTNSEDMEGRPLFHRFAKADSMKVVPLPLFGDYTSLSDHSDLDESQMSYVPTGKRKVIAPFPAGRQNRPFLVPTDRGYSPSENPFSNAEVEGIFDSGCSISMAGNKERLDGFQELQLFNLFSISQICDKKNRVLFTDTECLVLSKDFKLLNESMVVLRVPKKHNLYTINLNNLCPMGNLACLVAHASVDESMKWHKRMSHVNYKNMNRLVKGNLVRGLPPKLFKNDHTCVACCKGKQHKASYKAINAASSISEPLQLLHMDLFGPTSIRSIDHKYYCLMITDDYSRFCWVFFLEYKDATYPIFREFINLVENQLNKKVKAIRCDNGTEFKNAYNMELCGSKGIKREYSNARTPQQNGFAERKNRTLIEAARTMLADSKLPTMFWTEAVRTACYVLNIVLVTSPHNTTPYDLLTGNIYSVSHFKPFGCHVTILNTSDHLGKFDGKADEGYIVGYSKSNKAYWVYNVPNKMAINMFKLTNLQEHKEPQLILQETKPKDTSSDEVDDYLRNSADEIFQKEPARLKVPPGSIPVPTGYIPVLVGATMVSTDDLPVHTSSLTESFFDDEPTTRFPCPSDLGNHDPSPGIFSSSSYDDQFGATLNNVASTVEVSPVATTRINTIHPQYLIIRDPTLVVQTRSKVLVDLPADKYAIGTKWILKNKRDARGIVVRNKARLVAQGHRREEGINYDEVFAPVMDVKSAFLYERINEEAWCDEFEALMNGEFQMSAMGELTFFLGLQVQQRPDGIFINQDKYVQEILNKFDLGSVKTATTPYEAPKPKSKNESNSLVNVHLYRSMIGSLMYLTTSWLDIMFVISACSRNQVTYTTSNLEAVKKIFKYLKGQPKLALWYPKELPLVLEAYSDSDYAGANKDRKTTTGGCQFLGRRLISWQCKKQTIVATSSTEAEYVAAANCYSQSLYVSPGSFKFFYWPYLVPSACILMVQDDGLVLFKCSTWTRDEYNKVGYLLKPTGSDDYHHQIIDFLRASHIRSPELGPPAIQGTIDKTPYTITEDLVRSQLQLADDGGIDDLPIAKIYSGMDNLGTKSSSWDQFGSPIAVSLMCLSDGRQFNWSSYIFKGMVRNIGNAKKLLMYPRFLQAILGIETRIKRQYKVLMFSSKLFANMRLHFEGHPMPLLPAMLLQAQAGEVFEHGQSSDPNTASFSRSYETDAGPFTNVEDEPLEGSFHMSPPRSTQAPPAGQPSGGTEDPITQTALSSVVSTLVQKVNFLETELKDHKKLFKDVVGKLVKKVKSLEVKLKTKKRKMVVSDYDQKEGGKQDVNLDALRALANAAVTVDSNIPPGGASNTPAASTSIPVAVPTGALTVPAGSPSVPANVPPSVAPAGVSNKGKSPMVEEDIPVKARTFKQIQEDILGEQAAKRLNDEEQAQLDRQRAELQRRRQQEVLDSAMYYTEEDWIYIRAQVEANASLSKTLLSDDVSKDNFPARMIQAFSQSLKRTGPVLKEPSSKRQKYTEALIPSVPDVPQSPVVSSPPSSGKRRKSLGRKRLTKPKSTLQELDLDADAQTFIKVVSTKDSDDEAPPIWSALVGWEVLFDSYDGVKLMERMLMHKLEIDTDVARNDMTTAEQLI
nr:putative ribonuclease H-like domain-containing protein [Tanacetum cinerariifolium]